MPPCRGEWGGAWGTGWDRQSTPRATGQGLGTAAGLRKEVGLGDAERKAGGGKTPFLTGQDSAAVTAAPQRQEGCSCWQHGCMLSTPVWAPTRPTYTRQAGAQPDVRTRHTCPHGGPRGRGLVSSLLGQRRGHPLPPAGLSCDLRAPRASRRTENGLSVAGAPYHSPGYRGLSAEDSFPQGLSGDPASEAGLPSWGWMPTLRTTALSPSRCLWGPPSLG